MAATKDWVLKDAQELISAMRVKVNSFGYDIALGGGVIANAKSQNDLDLFFIPLCGTTPPRPIELLLWMSSKFGLGKTIIAPITINPATGLPFADAKIFTHKMRFDLAGRKIDTFVL